MPTPGKCPGGEPSAQLEAAVTKEECSGDAGQTQRHEADGSEPDPERGENETDDRDQEQDRSGSEIQLQPPSGLLVADAVTYRPLNERGNERSSCGRTIPLPRLRQ